MTDWQAVEGDLAAIWVDAPDRQEVTDAANVMERLFKQDPLNVGEARDGNSRILIVAPLRPILTSLSMIVELWFGNSGAGTRDADPFT
jgi:hypothetical protein